METIDDIGCVFNFDSTELDVGSGCDVHDTTFSVLFDAFGIKSQLIRIDNSIGYLETHHKLTRSSLVSVKHTNVFNTGIEISFLYILPCHFSLAYLSGVFVDINPCVDGIFGQFNFFGRVSLRATFDSFLGEERGSCGFVDDDGASNHRIFVDGTEHLCGNRLFHIGRCEGRCRRKDDRGCNSSNGELHGAKLNDSRQLVLMRNVSIDRSSPISISVTMGRRDNKG
mmetsp:Transcript_32461/g.76350  ORF Transcript_32461/g.76350 Transcript_32461/m.76350 type:complete len:226 (-) Transcript_32461:27-704(-)